MKHHWPRKRGACAEQRPSLRLRLLIINCTPADERVESIRAAGVATAFRAFSEKSSLQLTPRRINRNASNGADNTAILLTTEMVYFVKISRRSGAYAQSRSDHIYPRTKTGETR